MFVRGPWTVGPVKDFLNTSFMLSEVNQLRSPYIQDADHAKVVAGMGPSCGVVWASMEGKMLSGAGFQQEIVRDS